MTCQTLSLGTVISIMMLLKIPTDQHRNIDRVLACGLPEHQRLDALPVAPRNFLDIIRMIACR